MTFREISRFHCLREIDQFIFIAKIQEKKLWCYGDTDNKGSFIAIESLKNVLSCLTQFLATEIPLKMTKNAFHLYLKFLS